MLPLADPPRLTPGCHLYEGPDGVWRYYLPADKFVRITAPTTSLQSVRRLLAGHPDTEPTADTRALLAALAEQGVLATPPPPLRRGRIQVRGNGPIADLVTALLAPAHDLVDQSAPVTADLDVVIACAGWLPDAAWQELDAACTAAGVAWHGCYAEGTRWFTGPMAVPGPMAVGGSLAVAGHISVAGLGVGAGSGAGADLGVGDMPVAGLGVGAGSGAGADLGVGDMPVAGSGVGAGSGASADPGVGAGRGAGAGRTARYADTRARRLGACGAPDELRAYWSYLDHAADVPPVPWPGPGVVALIAGALIADVDAYLTTGAPAAVGRQLEIDPVTLTVTPHPVLPLPFEALAWEPTASMHDASMTTMPASTA